MKAILLGDSCVGKSTLLTCIRDNQNVIPTIGVDCVMYNDLQVWDTSGHRRFKRVIEVFYPKMDTFVFVYKDLESLASIENIRREVMSSKKRPARYLLVYNGKDKKIRFQGKMYAMMYNFKFVQGDLSIKKHSKRVMDTIEKCTKTPPNGWRYCWFY